MGLVSLGKITVASAGTPVQFSSTVLNCNAVYISTITGQSGQQMYIGVKSFVKATLVGVLKILQKPIASTPVYLDNWVVQSNVAAGPIDLSTLYVDADTTNDAVLVSYLVL